MHESVYHRVSMQIDQSEGVHVSDVPVAVTTTATRTSLKKTKCTFFTLKDQCRNPSDTKGVAWCAVVALESWAQLLCQGWVVSLYVTLFV